MRDGASKMPHVWKAREKRQKLCKRQNNKCYWCGIQMNRIEHHPKSATLDHLVRRADGGGGNAENLVVACRECNGKRGQSK